MSKTRIKKVFRWIFAVLAVFYVLFVIKITFVKDGVRLETQTHRLIPFNGIYDYRLGLKSAVSLAINYLGNVAMFFPAGIFLPVVFKKLNIKKTVLIGLLLSVTIEILQYITASGYSDIDDIIMNTVGVFIGSVTYFYILGGRKGSILSYIISLFVILAIEIGGLASVWYLSPNLLPDSAINMGGMIAGKKLDSYNVRVQTYKMSHGEVFINKSTATDKSGNKIDKKEGSYFISDTAICVTETDADGKKHYRILGIDDMIETVEEVAKAQQHGYVKLWLSPSGECLMIMLEQ